MEGVGDTLGYIRDFYFDDHEWVIRYIVADTHRWLPGRDVLVSPQHAGEADWASRTLKTNLTGEQMKQSPGVEEDLPVSKQEKLDISNVTLWAPLWYPLGTPLVGMPVTVSAEVEGDNEQEEPCENTWDPRLRSVREVIGYAVSTPQDRIATIRDFILETEGWLLRYLVADTGGWLSGKRVLIAPLWVERVDWANAEIHTDLPTDMIKEAPPFDPQEAVNREYEERLYDYYGRPAYWKE